MRSCFGLFLLLIVLGYGAYRWPAAPVEPAAPSIGAWRRTADGWQRRSVWEPRARPFFPLIHPATITAFASLATLIALIVLAPSDAPDVSHVSPPGWHVSRLPSAPRPAPFMERRKPRALVESAHQSVAAHR